TPVSGGRSPRLGHRQQNSARYFAKARGDRALRSPCWFRADSAPPASRRGTRSRVDSWDPKHRSPRHRGAPAAGYFPLPCRRSDQRMTARLRKGSLPPELADELEIAIVAALRVAARAFLRGGLALQTAFGAIRRAALGLGHRSHGSGLVGPLALGGGEGRMAEQKTQQQDR